MGHMAFRATSPEALQRRVAVIEKHRASGAAGPTATSGTAPAYAFTTPDGHNMEIYYETEWYAAPAALKPALKNQAMRFPARGVNVRRLDHLNLLAADVAPTAALHRRRARHAHDRDDRARQRRGGRRLGDRRPTRPTTSPSPATTTAPAAASTMSPTRSTSREDVLRAADIFLEHGVHIETGPHKHAVQQTFFLYVYEPGGNRVEVANAGARLMLAPDWQPVVWTEAERKKGPGVGPQDDRELPHPRHAADGTLHRAGDSQHERRDAAVPHSQNHSSIHAKGERVDSRGVIDGDATGARGAGGDVRITDRTSGPASSPSVGWTRPRVSAPANASMSWCSRRR